MALSAVPLSIPALESSPCLTTPEVIQVGLAMAVENIENYLKGKPTHAVTPH